MKANRKITFNFSFAFAMNDPQKNENSQQQMTYSHKETSTQQPAKPAKKIDYSIKMGSALLERINQHIETIKRTDNNSQSRQRWVVEAIKEKLKSELKTIEKITLEEHSPPKVISFVVDENIHKQLEKIAQITKNHYGIFSKKLWMLQSIEEKLKRDEKKVRKFSFTNSKNSSSSKKPRKEKSEAASLKQ